MLVTVMISAYVTAVTADENIVIIISPRQSRWSTLPRLFPDCQLNYNLVGRIDRRRQIMTSSYRDSLSFSSSTLISLDIVMNK